VYLSSHKRLTSGLPSISDRETFSVDLFQTLVNLATLDCQTFIEYNLIKLFRHKAELLRAV